MRLTLIPIKNTQRGESTKGARDLLSSNTGAPTSPGQLPGSAVPSRGKQALRDFRSELCSVGESIPVCIPCGHLIANELCPPLLQHPQQQQLDLFKWLDELETQEGNLLLGCL